MALIFDLFSEINRESLIKVRELVIDTKNAAYKDIELSNERMSSYLDKVTASNDKIYYLTCDYYELMPLTKYNNQIATLRSPSNINNLDGLSNPECASKILLEALYNIKEHNPADCIDDALKMIIESLDKESSESEVINKYMSYTN